MSTETLQAGREMDAAVAEMMEPAAGLPQITAREARIQCWGPDPAKWTWYSVAYFESPRGWWQAQIGTDHGPPEDDRLPVRWVPAREPSEDIAAAWEVAEKMGILVSPTLFRGLDGFTRWGAGVFKGCTGHPDGGQRFVKLGTWAEGKTAPEAICRAALKAVEMDS